MSDHGAGHFATAKTSLPALYCPLDGMLMLYLRSEPNSDTRQAYCGHCDSTFEVVVPTVKIRRIPTRPVTKEAK